MASELSEGEFLDVRTCGHFRVRLEDRIDGFAVQMTHGKDEEPIGKAFFIYYTNSDSEKTQFFENTPLILYYLAGQLDKANKEHPISGSYGPEYFKERVRKKIPNILEKQGEIMGVD